MNNKTMENYYYINVAIHYDESKKVITQRL